MTLTEIQADFARFETSDKVYDPKTIAYIKTKIVRETMLIGMGLEALDPTGNSSAEEIQARLDAAGAIKLAQAKFARFETSGAVYYDAMTIAAVKEGIVELTTRGGKGLEALDLTGNSSTEEMQARLDAAEQRANLIAARANFARFETSSAVYDAMTIASIKEGIVELTTRGGKGLEALDLTGNSSTEEMQARLDAAEQRALSLGSGLID